MFMVVAIMTSQNTEMAIGQTLKSPHIFSRCLDIF